MEKMQVINEYGEIIFERDVSAGWAAQVVTGEGYLKLVGGIGRAWYGGDHEIVNGYYRRIAAALCEKFEELAHIDPGSILFLVNRTWEPPKSGTGKWTWIARVKKADKSLERIWGYGYIMELKGWYVREMTPEQRAALVYHELRHIGQEGELLHHDIEDWGNMVATFGAGWAGRNRQIDNILGEDFQGFEDLGPGGRQMTIYERGTPAAKGAETDG